MLKHINALMGVAACNQIRFPEHLEGIQQGQDCGGKQRRHQIGQRNAEEPPQQIGRAHV